MILTHTTPWMNPENTTLSEGTRQKTARCMTPFLGNVQNREISRKRKCTGGCLELRQKWRMAVNGYKVSFWGDENVLNTVVMAAQLWGHIELNTLNE